MLLPALSRARASALRVVCASNLHQLSVALRLYLDDFRKYPAFESLSEAQHGYFDAQYTGIWAPRSGFWDHKLLTYVRGGLGVFVCPANGTAKDPNTNWFFRDGSLQVCPNLSYGYNVCGTANFFEFLPTPTFLGLGGTMQVNPDFVFCLPESSVMVPAEMVAIADEDLLATDDDHDLDFSPELLFRMGLTGRHAGGANASFCDGHVEYAKTNRWTAPIDEVRRRWNYDHQPHRETWRER